MTVFQEPDSMIALLETLNKLEHEKKVLETALDIACEAFSEEIMECPAFQGGGECLYGDGCIHEITLNNPDCWKLQFIKEANEYLSKEESK